MSSLASLSYPKAFADKKSPILIYEELAATFRSAVENSNDFSKSQIEKYRRILLLGAAFRKDGNFLAERFFNSWLLGPNLSSFDDSPSVDSIGSNFGPPIKVFDNKEARPWIKVNWSEIESQPVKQLRETAFQLAIKSITDKNFSKRFIELLKKELTQQKVGFNGTFGDIKSSSLENPKYLLLSPQNAEDQFDQRISVKTWEQLWREKSKSIALLLGGGNLSLLLLLMASSNMIFKEISKMPDIISALGSFGLFVYAKGNLEVQQGSTNSKKKGIFSFTHIGIRIIDQYDFIGWQTLGCWYPEKGHDLSSVIFSFGIDSQTNQSANGTTLGLPITYKGCSLLNSDFDEFRSHFKEKFNRASGTYKLLCQDLYVISPMLIKSGFTGLPSYEIEV
jgi:hypothetical protein